MDEEEYEFFAKQPNPMVRPVTAQGVGLDNVEHCAIRYPDGRFIMYGDDENPVDTEEKIIAQLRDHDKRRRK